MNPTSKTQTPEPESSQDPTPENAAATAPTAGESDVRDEAVPAARKADSSEGPDAADGALVVEFDDEESDESDDDFADELAAERGPSGLGSMAGAFLALALGIVGLTGTWFGKVLSEREALSGQVKLDQSATAAKQISEGYADAWHASAAANGVVALIALLVGAIVVALPQRTGWVRPVAIAGAVLGFVGILVSVGMYFDIFASIPVPPAPPAAPAAP
ncbi:hypothetical protein ACIO1C_27885 [Streptomyces sp. NPDC087420]|uniref:hypothetical protein n=1 Tax=Streptomyces sp. NPDC087420 TaxID=3365785 RepID=UPI003832DD66